MAIPTVTIHGATQTVTGSCAKAPPLVIKAIDRRLVLSQFMASRLAEGGWTAD